uniref:Uncharacterized protein n=1 Tax=virus sp. ct9pU4 TaxID=2828248 RepID=A0A8S5RAK2_9VIRU|nr:MAG TPA: hypothetical protein [virus sp. ct9pU4]
MLQKVYRLLLFHSDLFTLAELPNTKRLLYIAIRCNIKTSSLTTGMSQRN